MEQQAIMNYILKRYNDFIDVYIQNRDSTVNHFKSGYLYPASQKEIVEGSYYVPLPINQSEIVDVYIKVQEKIHVDPEFDLRLESHGFVDGIPISWYGQKNATNQALSLSEIENRERDLPRRPAVLSARNS